MIASSVRQAPEWDMLRLENYACRLSEKTERLKGNLGSVLLDQGRTDLNYC